MHVTRWLLGQRLLCVVCLYVPHHASPGCCCIRAMWSDLMVTLYEVVLWLHYGCVMAAASARRETVVTVLWPPFQPGENKRVCSSHGSWSLLPASLLLPCLPWVQCTQTQWDTVRQSALWAGSARQLASWTGSYKGTISMRIPPSCPNYHPKAPCPNTNTLRIQHMNLGWHQVYLMSSDVWFQRLGTPVQTTFTFYYLVGGLDSAEWFSPRVSQMGAVKSWLWLEASKYSTGQDDQDGF